MRLCLLDTAKLFYRLNAILDRYCASNETRVCFCFVLVVVVCSFRIR